MSFQCYRKKNRYLSHKTTFDIDDSNISGTIFYSFFVSPNKKVTHKYCFFKS
jgi:hypothetical protein